MTNQKQHQTQFSSPPSSDGKDQNTFVDIVAEHRKIRQWLKSQIDCKHQRLEKVINQKIIDTNSRIKKIRQPVEELKYNKEENELQSFQDYIRTKGDSSAYHAYVVEAVSKLDRQLKMLRNCVASSTPCKLMACPRCSPSLRAEAVAEASAYLWKTCEERKHARFYSVTITTDIWVLPLYKADELMRKSMAHTLRTLFSNLKNCSDILMTIEGSLDKRLARLKAELDEPLPAKGTLEYRMKQAVVWHLHGVLVCDNKCYGKHQLTQDIEQIFRMNNSGFQELDVKVEPLKITGLQRRPDHHCGEKWLLYITKFLTGDTFNADNRRAFRYATNDLCTSGLMSTGPILYACRDLTHAENYLAIQRAKRDEKLERIEQADSSVLAQLVEQRRAELGLKA